MSHPTILEKSLVLKLLQILRNVVKYKETTIIPVRDGFPKWFQYFIFNILFIYSFIFES